MLILNNKLRAEFSQPFPNALEAEFCYFLGELNLDFRVNLDFHIYFRIDNKPADHKDLYCKVSYGQLSNDIIHFIESRFDLDDVLKNKMAYLNRLADYLIADVVKNYSFNIKQPMGLQKIDLMLYSSLQSELLTLCRYKKEDYVLSLKFTDKAKLINWICYFNNKKFISETITHSTVCYELLRSQKLYDRINIGMLSKHDSIKEDTVYMVLTDTGLEQIISDNVKVIAYNEERDPVSRFLLSLKTNLNRTA